MAEYHHFGGVAGIGDFVQNAVSKPQRDHFDRAAELRYLALKELIHLDDEIVVQPIDVRIIQHVCRRP
ncbi:hypothetical protein MALU111345_16480 [Marinicrinis lubricantis]